MEEEWRDIPNFEGLYQVSNLGNVRSLDRIVKTDKGQRKLSGRILKSQISSTGYYMTRLSKLGKTKTYLDHQLVAIGFLGHIPNSYETVINHINNDPLDNRLENLEITSQRENTSIDRWRGDYSSKYIGVTRHKQSNKWVSMISINDSRVYLGLFIDEGKASEMYIKALEHKDLYTGNPKQFRTMLNKLT